MRTDHLSYILYHIKINPKLRDTLDINKNYTHSIFYAIGKSPEKLFSIALIFFSLPEYFSFFWPHGDILKYKIIFRTARKYENERGCSEKMSRRKEI